MTEGKKSKPIGPVTGRSKKDIKKTWDDYKLYGSRPGWMSDSQWKAHRDRIDRIRAGKSRIKLDPRNK